MTKYKTRPAEVDARQFSGGEQNGKALEAWVNSLGGNSSWTPGHKFTDLEIPEEFHLGTSKMHMKWNLILGSWLVYQDGFISIYSEEDFQSKFEED